MNTIMLTIRKRHWNHIKSGCKRYELRRNRPAAKMPIRVLCCVSGTGGQVFGEFMVLDAREARVNDRLAQSACVTIEELEAYRADGLLYAWSISRGSVLAYKRPKHIADYGVERVPQSWCYVKGD